MPSQLLGAVLSTSLRRAEIEKKFQARETVEADGRVIIPGLINGHTHIPMTLFRGLADDLDLQEWLTKYIFPAEAKNVTEEFVRVGHATGSGGNDSRRHHDLLRHVLLRRRHCRRDRQRPACVAVLGETVIDFPVADNKTNAEAMAYVEKFVKRWQGNDLIVPAIAPHAPYTVSEEHLKAVRAFSDRTGAPIVTHISETKREVDDSLKAKGVSPIDYLARIGFLNDRVIAAHVVWPSSGGDRSAEETGRGSGPQSAIEYEAGRRVSRRCPKMLAAGLRVGLGTDGAASNNDLNMWEEMDTAPSCTRYSAAIRKSSRPRRPLSWRRFAAPPRCIWRKRLARSKSASAPTS